MEALKDYLSKACVGGGTCLPAGRLVDMLDMFEVYVIRSQARNYTYIGLTNNLVRRLREHQQGLNKTTKPYRPFVLIYTEKFQTRSDARVREKYLKSGSGKEWVKPQI